MIPDLQQLSTTTRDLRKFGLVVGGVFSLLGGWFLFRHNSAGPYFLIQGVVLVLVGFVAPRALEVVYIALDESGLYYGSACLHSGPHALLLQLAHWTQGIGLVFGLHASNHVLELLRVRKKFWLIRIVFFCFC